MTNTSDGSTGTQVLPKDGVAVFQKVAATEWKYSVGVQAGEINDLTAAVTWDDIPIANVPTGTTSSTVSLGNHLHDSIADTNLLDKTAAEVVSGHWNVPSTINVQNGNYTLVIGDAGKTIHKVSGGAGETITIPANGAEAIAVGSFVGFQNDGGGILTIAINTDLLTGTDGVTGSRILGDNHVAVIQKMTATTWKYAASDL